MNVTRRMTRDPETLGPKRTVAEARVLMDAGGFRRMPIVDNGRLVGIISDRDVRRYQRDELSTPIEKAMTRDPVTLTTATSVEQAARLMLKHKIGGLPVMEHDKLVGILTTTDVLKAFLDLIQASQALMNP